MTTPSTSKHIFISYARSDGKEYAAKLDDDLRAAGYQTWRDLRNLNEYQDFSAEIEANIQLASYVAVCVTPSIDANPSSFVRREIIYAESKGKPIIPLVFPKATVPTLINHLTWIPFFDQKTEQLSYESGVSHLLARLNGGQEKAKARDVDDPYREYLKTLYDQIVRYLNLTVFSLLSLQSDATPEAVETSAQNVLPMAFWEMAGVDDKIDDIRQFNDFNEAFEAYEGRVLLLGEPGGGKTTTMFALARDAVVRRLEDPSLPLPILAPISTWDAQTQTLLADWLTDTVSVLKRDDLAHLIDSGHTLLLLDGLDELGGERPIDPQKPDGEMFDPRRTFLNLIPSDNKVIISCRVKEYFEIEKKTTLKGSVTLKPLNDNQMKMYLREMPDLWSALEGDMDLREIARTPLLLSLFTFAFRDLPEQARTLSNLKESDLRDRIFEVYVRRRYDREIKKPFSQITFSFDEICEILSQLSVRGGNIQITKSESRYIFSRDNLITYEDLSAVIRDHTQIKSFVDLAVKLHLLTPSSNKFRFMHLLLKNYFAFKYTLSLLNHDDPSIRGQAAKVLGEFGDTRAAELLIPRLNDDDVSVQRYVAVALGKLGIDKSIATLISALRDDDMNVRFSAAWALGELGESSIEALIIALKDNNPYRYYSALALKIQNDIRTYDALISCLNDADWRVRFYGALALGELGDVRCADMLVALLNDDIDMVILRATVALINLGDKRAIDGFFVFFNTDDVSSMQQSVLNELRHKLDISVDKLIKSLGSTNSDVRAVSAKVLGMLHAREAVESLIERLKDQESKVRCYVIKALGSFRDQRIVELLIIALKDHENKVRKTAIIVLANLGDKRAVKPLISALSDTDADIRAEIVRALGRLNDPQAVEPVIRTLNDPDTIVRSNSANVLGKFGDIRGVEPLIDILNDPNICINAINSLGLLGDSRAIKPLTAILFRNAMNKEVRSAVIAAFTNIDTPEALAVVKLWQE